ncbi:hypothetical protein E4T56_gene1014, partial [Termitomyces sp. T112]
LIFTISETFLALRVYVLTRKNICLALVFIFHLLAQLGLAIYIMSMGGTGLPYKKLDDNPSELQVCVLQPATQTMKYYTVYLALALSFDTLVFVATLFTTIAATRQYRAKPWLRVIQRDGIIYFMAIFSSTLIWLLLNEVGRSGLKFMNNIPDLILTSVMINRLYLSLKKAGNIENESLHLYLRKNQRPRTDVELQVVVSQHITSIVE